MMNRRAVLGLGAALLPVGAMADALPHEAVLSADPPAKTAAGRRYVSPPDCYFAYPHNNSFVPGSELPVIAQIAGNDLTLCEWNFTTGAMRQLVKTGIGNMYWDIALDAGELFLMDHREHIISVSTTAANAKPDRWPIAATPGNKMEGLVSVNRAATKLLCGVEHFALGTTAIDAGQMVEVDLATRARTPLCALPFSADHQQYCPFDENWIGFAHEGDIRRSLDRVWGLNRTLSDKPAVLWNEIAADGHSLLAGHERWAFHAAGALVVAYPGSEGHPQGLYFVDAPARKARLVSASSYDWHCNISRDGVWAVVDTKPPRGRAREADGRAISDIVLVHVPTGQRQWVARSHASPAGHPWHPHPHFSPDGRYVIYNDFAADGVGTPGRVVMVELVRGIPV